MQDMTGLKAIIEKKGFFPIVPLVNYSKITKVKWGKEENWIRSIEELKGSYKNNVTGYSLLCGEKSNVMVMDIDVNHNDNVNGFDSLKEFMKDLSTEDRKQFYNTFLVKTPRGGNHFYFKYKKGLKSKANYLPGIDIKTDGGIIVLPGTKVKIDNEIKEYTLVNQSLTKNNIVEMPQALFDKLIELNKKTNKKVAKVKEIDNTINTSIYKEGCRNQELFKESIGYISDSRIRDIDAIFTIVKGINLVKCSPPLEDEEVNNIVGSIVTRLHPSYCDSKGNIDNYALVQEVLKQKPSYVKGNLLFQYIEEGFYKGLDNRQMKRIYFDYAINNADKTALKSNKFQDLIMILADTLEEDEEEHEKRFINCKNGVIDIDNNKLLPHDPEYKLQVQFKANYDKECLKDFENSKFNHFLETTLSKDDIKTIKQVMGLFLSPHAREVEKMIILKGKGSNGKSVFFDILESLIDKKFIAGIGLGEFEQEFILAMLEGKFTNIVRDDKAKSINENKVKSIVTGEEITVNRKGKDHIRLKFNMLHLFGLNNLPHSKDKSYGFFRRQLIINFNNTFGTKEDIREGKAQYLVDKTIGKHIIENERDIVFNWAYEGLQELKANNWTFEESQASKEELEEYRKQVDTVYAFYKDQLIESEGSIVTAQELYSAYTSYCHMEGILLPVTNTKFGRTIKDHVLCNKNSRPKTYLNIKIIPFMVDSDFLGTV